ncbi:glycosyltransferase family 4 protein [Photobacterium kagoshimensis]|uniref:glycosyltransferase family 4 protein n=1 Tax=Photobacterium kagoshimensis TaxID=2910242 RepID=UPI003D0F64D5
MKILYHHRIASKDGQYVHIDAIVSALREQGHTVIMVAPNIAEQSDFGSDGGWVSRLRHKLPKFISELLEFGYCFYDFIKLCQAIKKHQPDAIYERYNLYLPSGIWAKQLFKLPLILEVNSPLYQERMNYGGVAFDMLAKWSEYYTWRNADRILPVTEVLAGYVRDAGVTNQKITVIHNGIDKRIFSPALNNKRHTRFENKLVVGFVGFCREWHQLDQVLTMLAHHQADNVMFLIVGDGPVLEALKDQAKAMGMINRIHITGLVSREDMPYWLEQIDIAIQPAVTPWCSPLKLIEYLATAKAIVAPNTPNIRELITHEVNGLLFEPNDMQNLLKKIEQLIDDKPLRNKLKQNAIQTINNKELEWILNATKISFLINSELSASSQPCPSVEVK